jgi:broad specificity phosphatase PhoE
MNDHESEYYITLLRHAESVGNAEGRFQGQADYPLNERGRQQAQALASRWKAETRSFSKAIASPLRRARETAEIIANAMDIPLEFDEIWMERDYGELTGVRWDDAAMAHPRPEMLHPYLPTGEHGEGQWDLYLRAGRALHSVLRRPPDRYLIVSHGGILNLVLYAVLGITPQANFQGPRFQFGNTCFAELIYQPGHHKWQVITLNDGGHRVS